MKNALLVLAILLASLSSLTAQGLIPYGNHFMYDGEFINKNQVQKLMRDKPQAYMYYTKSQNQFSNAKMLGVTSLISLSTGLLTTLVSAPAVLFSESAQDNAEFGLLLMAGGCITGTIGIVTRNKAKRNFDKSILMFNYHDNHSTKDEFTLDLSVSGNGAGIRYTF